MKKKVAKRLLGFGLMVTMGLTGTMGYSGAASALAASSEAEEAPETEAADTAEVSDTENDEASSGAGIDGAEQGADAQAGSENKEQNQPAENGEGVKDEAAGVEVQTEDDAESAGRETEGAASDEAAKAAETTETAETTEAAEVAKAADEAEPKEQESLLLSSQEDDDADVQIESVVVETKVTKLGQYPDRMIVELKDALPESVELEAGDFEIKASMTGWLASEITQEDIPVDVTGVEIAEDRKSVAISVGRFPERYYYIPVYSVTCAKVPGLSFAKEQTKTVTPVADDFEYVSENGFSYNIYTPEKQKQAAAVIVFHGFGDDENLYANRIAVEWAEDYNQEVRPTYVIAPQFGGYGFVSPDVRQAVYAGTKSVVDALVEEGKVDPGRIYVTGKSFGGAAVIEFDETYPGYGAASLAMAPAVAYTDFFGGVTDEENLKKILDQPLWLAQCESDTTAPYQGTVAMYDTLEKLGASDLHFTRYTEDEMNAAGANGDWHGVECAVMDGDTYMSWLFSKTKTETDAEETKAAPEYEVLLPEDYETSGANYPVVYVMPNDGLNRFSDVMMERIESALGNSTMDMIVAKLSFEEGDDPYDVTRRVIEDVDSKLRTVKGASFRCVIGEEVGGYLAHALTYTDGKMSFASSPALFGLMASVNGDYVGSGNVWAPKFGNMLDIMRLNNASALSFYTYLSAASEDERTYVEGGAGDVIKYFIQNASAYYGFITAYFGNADAYSQNFSIKNASFDRSFEEKAVSEAIAGFNRRLTQNLVTGSLSLSPQSALASVEEITASYSVSVNDAFDTFFGENEKNINLKVVMADEKGSEVLCEVTALDENVKKGKLEGTVTLPNLVNNVSTSVNLVATLAGTTFVVDTTDLIRILATGTAPEDQLIDFMGTWKVKAIADNAFDKNDWVDENGNLSLGDVNEWGDGTPCITWWNGANGVERNFVGYAWYVRKFDIPADFSKGTYQMPIGYLDEGDVTFINGVQIGQTGMTPDTWAFESDQWDTYRSYEVSPEILNFGGENYVAVLAHNASGDGGWYKGHPGLYSQAAYNRLNAVPSQLADKTAAGRVKKAVEDQMKAISKKDIGKYSDTVAADYFQSGTDKDMLLDVVKGYMKGYEQAAVTDAEGAVYEAGGGLYLYQARRSISTGSGEKLEMEVNDYFRIEKNKALLCGQHDRFYTQYIDSAYRAKAMKSGADTERESFLVYLPEGYFDEANADKRYPTAYIFHQINSSSNSWKIDGINEYLDAGIASGMIKNTILVIPDSQPQSWWSGDWVNMVTEDIVPFIDSHYRTVDDARFRFTVGASMGGSGSYNIGLRNPDLFSGIISYFGAINMGEMPLDLARDQYSKGYLDYLKYYKQYFVCGNQDLYKFGIPAIELDHLLRNVKIDHFFELEEGAHDSTFYQPYVIDSFSYMTSRIPTVTAGEADSALGIAVSEVKVSGGKVSVSADVFVKGGVSGYLHSIPASDFTRNSNPALKIPVTARLVDESGVTVARQTKVLECSGEAAQNNLVFDIEDLDVTTSGKYTAVVAANLLDYPVQASKSVKGSTVKPSRPLAERNMEPAEETPASEASSDGGSGSAAPATAAAAIQTAVTNNAAAAGNNAPAGSSQEGRTKGRSSSAATEPSVQEAESTQAVAEQARAAETESAADTSDAQVEVEAKDEAAPADTVDAAQSNEETETVKNEIEDAEVPLAGPEAQSGMTGGATAAVALIVFVLIIAGAAIGFLRLRGKNS